MFETVMFENVMFATARFETVMCESVMFDSVMFETVRWARVDFFMNTPLEQLGWETNGIVHITKKLGWEPWRRLLYTHQKRVEKSSRPGYDQYSLRIAFTRRLGWRTNKTRHAGRC